MSAAVVTPSRTFYSRSAHLSFYAGKPKRIESDGQKIIDEGPMVAFHPLGDGWGIFTTDDPILIAACEARKDVVGPDAYNLETTPADVRISNAETKADRLQRELEEKNRLIEKLRSGQKN